VSAINLRGSGFLSGTNALRFPRRFLLFFETLFLFEDSFSDCGQKYSFSVLSLIKAFHFLPNTLFL
jgi:hypothetical protein